MFLVSGCLLGIDCKYSGGNNRLDLLIDYLADKKVAIVCPEQLGGLSTPRSPAEIQGGDGRDVLWGKARVISQEGKDVTENFIKGARETLKIARLWKIKKAIFKERSPSCGSREIYDGTFSGRVVAGCGVTTALLRENSIKVYREDEPEAWWD